MRQPILVIQFSGSNICIPTTTDTEEMAEKTAKLLSAMEKGTVLRFGPIVPNGYEQWYIRGASIVGFYFAFMDDSRQQMVESIKKMTDAVIHETDAGEEWRKPE